MAKFTDYTEKTEPVDTDLALIYDTPAKVNKKFTFGNLWKWIAKKIVSEGISQLDTTNKTIPGAINELNSKILKHREDITGTTTLEEYCADKSKLPGQYRVNGAIISGISNTEKLYGALILFSAFDLQILIVGGGQIYARDYTGSPKAWTKWSKYTRTLFS